MKYLVLSDIHGGAQELETALAFFDKLSCQRLVLLGDLLNHGPRNRVPQSYEPPAVARLLNTYAERIVSIRGNCDSEVDGMMFSFPCNAPYGYLFIENETKMQKIFLTHGHLHRFESAEGAAKLGLASGDIVLSGHTHVSGIFKCPSGVININPGSTTLPKGGTEAGFAVIDETEIKLCSLTGSEILCYKFS